MLSKDMSRKISAIAIDMDHTLLDSGFNLSEVDARAIKKVSDSGVVIIIATGRMPDAVVKKINDIIGYVDYAVCYNGALVLDVRYGRRIYSCDVPWKVFFEMYENIDKAVYHFALFSYDKVYVAGSEDDEMMQEYRRRTGAMIQEVRDIKMIRDIPVHKYLVYKKNIEKSDGWVDVAECEIYNVVSELVRDKLNVIKTRLGYVECINKDVSKWTSIKKVLNQIAISEEDMMCVGDGYNDIEMVKYAGIGIAVDNAIPELKRVADVIVADNNSSGVSQAIDIAMNMR